MFSLLPATNSCVRFVCCPENPQAVGSSQRNWNKLGVAGLALDILIVASLCIAISLAVCSLHGIPLGAFNGISFININTISTLSALSGAIVLVDFCKIIYHWKKSDQKLVKNPEIKGSGSNPIPLRRRTIPHTPSVTASTVVNADPPAQSSVATTPDPTSQPQHIELGIPLMQFPVELPKPPQTEIQEDFDNVDSDGQTSTYTPAAQTWIQALWNVAASVGQTVGQVAGLATNYVKTWISPGKIQMRFYELQINFLIEQILAYNETHNTFEEIPLPLSLVEKLEKLAEKKFEDQDIQNFKKAMVRIIKEQAGDPYYTRCSLLGEIETAYAKLSETSPLFQSFLQHLGFQLYTQFDAFSYGEDSVIRFLKTKEVTLDTLATVLESDRSAIKALPSEIIGEKIRDNRERLRGAGDVFFYPMLTNNFACRLWQEKYSNGKTVQIIRFGTPTSSQTASVLGQMNLFVKECETQKKTLFSFQHQTFNGEQARLQLMFDLAAQYPTAFYCLNLDMDSSFYHQTRRGIDSDTTNTPIEIKYADFKVDLIQHMIHLRMSENTKVKIDAISTYHDDLSQIADGVLRDEFSEVSDRPLTVKERQEFIFIFYTRYREYLHSKIAPDFSCHQCKDTMDRSMSLAIASYLANAKDLGQHNDPFVLRNVRTLTNFVGMIVKGSPMDSGRFERFIPVIQRLSSHNSTERHTRLTAQTLDSPSYNQKYTKLPCDVQDFAAYEACDLMRSSEHYVPVMPWTEESTLPQLVGHLYQNNGINCAVKIEGKNFTVFRVVDDEFVVVDAQDNTPDPTHEELGRGEFKIEAGHLAIKMSRRT